VKTDEPTVFFFHVAVAVAAGFVSWYWRRKSSLDCAFLFLLQFAHIVSFGRVFFIFVGFWFSGSPAVVGQFSG